jgi:hypothetical protein
MAVSARTVRCIPERLALVLDVLGRDLSLIPSLIPCGGSLSGSPLAQSLLFLMRNLGTINGKNLHLILTESETQTVINALAFYSELLGRKYHGREDFWDYWRGVARESLPEWADGLSTKISTASRGES